MYTIYLAVKKVKTVIIICNLTLFFIFPVDGNLFLFQLMEVCRSDGEL